MGDSKWNSSLRAVAVALCLTSAWIAFGCNSTPQPAPAPPDMRAAEEAAIRKADTSWAQAAQLKQPDLWMAFYSSDAVILPPNAKTATGKEAISKVISELLSLPGLDINWQLTKVEAAQSGDIAYAYGTYELSFNGPKGKPVSDTGKILEIWKKQPDGNWKCTVDTWSSDLPAAPASK